MKIVLNLNVVPCSREQVTAMWTPERCGRLALSSRVFLRSVVRMLYTSGNPWTRILTRVIPFFENPAMSRCNTWKWPGTGKSR